MKISKFNLSYLFEISKFIIANICLVRYQKNLKILKLVKFLRTIFQNFQSHEYHEGQKNSQVRISKTIFQNFQSHEYHISRWPEKSKNSQRFSKLNFAIIARKLYFKIFKITNFTSHRNRNDPKVTNITSHEDEKNIKILKD